MAKIRRIFDLRKDPEDKRDFKLSYPFQDNLKKFATSIPASIDWTPEMSPIKDQGGLGSCVAFAVTAAKEWQEQTEHKKEVKEGKIDTRKDKNYDLSESWVYWSCKEIDCWPNDEGTSIRYAMKVLHKIGVPVEKAWPYNDRVKGSPKSWAKMVAKWGLIKAYKRILTMQDMKYALTQGPIVAGIGVFDEIFNVGKNGIVAYPKRSNYCYGGHAICLVGYDQNKRLVKFKNSWGNGWGNKGYGFLSYRYCREFMWDCWSFEDLSVTKDMLKGAIELLKIKEN